MTETRFTWRWLLVVALVGIFIGLVGGLIVGWLVAPNIASSPIAALSASAQNDYIILVANTYALDQDIVRAKQRLALLHDPQIMARVERLAKALASRQDPAAANVADLAVALGSQDGSLQVLAEKVAAVDENSSQAPTKVARAEAPADSTQEQTGEDLPTAQPTAKRKKKDNPTPTPEAVAVTEPTQQVPPTKAAAEPTAVPATRSPQPTPEPTPVPAAPALTPEFIPPYPAGWWHAVKFIPAEVAPGQQYWRLRYARYCDWAPNDEFETCPGFPAGGMGHSIYIMVVDENGNCVQTEVTDILNDGSQHPLTPDMLKKIEFPWNPYGFQCDQDYEKEMYGEGNTISVPGLPSDKITELQLCATNPPPGFNPPPCGRAHVRYFLIFQRTTR